MALPIDWEAVSWLWSLEGYPSDPAHAQFAGKSLRGIRIWKVGGGAYDPEAGGGRGAPPGARVPRRGRRAAARLHGRARPPRPDRLRDRHRAARPLVVGGRALARGGRRRRAGRGGAAGHRGARRWPSTSRSSGRLAASTWGEGKDLRTWDSPAVADLAWAARRLELRLLRAPVRRPARSRREPGRPRAARRAGERLGLPRRPRRGRRLRLPARHRPRGSGARGHRITGQRHRPAHALAGPGPEPRSPDWRPSPADDPRPDPLLGVPAADRGRPGPPRAQALRGAGRSGRRGPRADPRRRGVAGRGAQRRGRRSTASASRSGPPTSASSSPGSSG